MDKIRLLRTLVAANVLLAFASVGAEAFFGWTLPPVLKDFTHAQFSDFPSTIHFLLLATTTLCAFAAWIGLLSYWRFARRLFLVSLVLASLTELFAGPSVRTSVGATLSAMDMLVAGAILGLVYFSELARRFEGAAITSTPAVGAGLRADRA